MKLKRDNFIKGIIGICFFTITLRLFYLQVIRSDYYMEKLMELKTTEISGTTSIRGRIYDRNYNIIVDNQLLPVIYYKKLNKVTVSEELKLAKKVAELIEVNTDSLTTTNLKEYWMAENPSKESKLITNDELIKYKRGSISSKEIYLLKLERITSDDLSIYGDEDKEVAYIYYLMNAGYKDGIKIIKSKNVSDYEFAVISENSHLLNGFGTKYEYERYYLYGDTFKTILGRVGSIPYENKDYYLSKGYNLSDVVGVSYIEAMYEDELRGKTETYTIIDGNISLKSKAIRGNDIVLNIDIKLQKELENILEEEIRNTKYEYNTKYYNRSFFVLQDTLTGGILAMSGKQIINNREDIVDYSPGIITSSVTAGSVIKGASILLGYKEGVIKPGSYMVDECIKIKSTPLKCSIYTMGRINDLEAIYYSSNVYQFKIAMKIGGGDYKYNDILSLKEDSFNKYRSHFEEFGLGVKTGIDLLNESTGYEGKSKLSGLLLDFAIGQYDTYTPIQLSQYITTIARGNRIKPSLLKEIRLSSKVSELGEIKKSIEPIILNELSFDLSYLERVKLAFKGVIQYGTGYGYVDKGIDFSGKTGTSESFIDTNNDGIVDTETISTSFVGYYPSDSPKVSLVITSPDVSYPNKYINYISNINKRLSRKIMNAYINSTN